MATNPFERVEHLEIARERVTEQFKGKDIFDKFLQILVAGDNDIQEALKDLMQLRSIDTAVGVQLDNIGEIVGQPRELLEADLYEYFGFQGSPNAQSMGTTQDATIGGLFYSFGTPFGGNVNLDDGTYRKFIKAKIFKNITSSTPEEFITVVNTIFDLPISITSEGDAQVTLMFGRILTSFERALLNYVSTSQGYPSRLIPKTVGVRINYGEFDGDSYFGFQGAPGAKGFGEFTGTYGYGLGWGLEYGDSDFVLSGDGGTFATLY
ncbi:MAG: hypothetical protein Tp178MES00d2C33159851_103 [Prokaryotic dsDNA virus sp.]|nr:MAG: hypothetical protein Tp178MES00d2C33159851_103 [Prokaryotic dsDNA virus sp.]|tara:strand:+ start:38366 stop:39160 length:795 start_codon:yes stop_codon:yes gene_type:complete